MGVLAGTPRTAARRVLALGGGAGGCGVLAVVLAGRVARLAGGGGDGAAAPQVGDLVELGVLAIGVVALAWLAASAGLAAACLVGRAAGHTWRRGEAWVQRFAPAVVRRALVIVVAAGMGAASVTAAAAEGLPPGTGPTVAATVSGGDRGLDLGWVVSTPAGSAHPSDTGSSVPPSPVPVATTGAPQPAPSDEAPRPHASEHPAPSDEDADADNLPIPPATDRPATPRPSAPATGTIVVRPGDTLWGIAARHLPAAATDAQIAAAWPAWYAANATVVGPDPDRIVPGQVLVVPMAVAR